MGPLGWPEMVFIFFLALLLFGPKKLPELARTAGKAMADFRRASNELKSTFDRELKNLEQETESLREVSNQFQSDTYSYDYSSYDSTYEGAYGSETHNSIASNPSTLSVSAHQDAESPAVLPEGTVAHGTEIASSLDTHGHVPEIPAHDAGAAAFPSEHHT
jgi:sec-independent protein translocase protein TatA